VGITAPDLTSDNRVLSVMQGTFDGVPLHYHRSSDPYDSDGSAGSHDEVTHHMLSVKGGNVKSGDSDSEDEIRPLALPLVPGVQQNRSVVLRVCRRVFGLLLQFLSHIRRTQPKKAYSAVYSNV
jgi:hypothetical protein